MRKSHHKNDHHSSMHNFMRKDDEDNMQESQAKEDAKKANQGQIDAAE